VKQYESLDASPPWSRVWLTRGQSAKVAEPARAPETPFAVRVELRPPHGRPPRVNSDLVKGVFDGVICAFQAHTDTTVLPDVVARLATVLPANPKEIEAVLGIKQRLVYPYRADVKWDPDDHMCVAGELIPAEPVGPRWAIKGELIELSR
jgi:hypothetical protein